MVMRPYRILSLTHFALGAARCGTSDISALPGRPYPSWPGVQLHIQAGYIFADYPTTGFALAATRRIIHFGSYGHLWERLIQSLPENFSRLLLASIQTHHPAMRPSSRPLRTKSLFPALRSTAAATCASRNRKAELCVCDCAARNAGTIQSPIPSGYARCMRVIRLAGFGGTEVLRIEKAEMPRCLIVCKGDRR